MTDRSTLEARLRQLREEFDRGQSILADLQGQESELRQKLLRISGAIEVIEELLQDGGEPAGFSEPGAETGQASDD